MHRKLTCSKSLELTEKQLKQFIPSDPRIDRDFVVFVHQGFPVHGINPSWRTDRPLGLFGLDLINSREKYKKQLEDIANHICASPFIQVAIEKERQIIAKRPAPPDVAFGSNIADIEKWIKTWFHANPPRKTGRPRWPQPSVMAVVLRDHFKERTGKPHMRQVGTLIGLLYPHYLESRADSGGTTHKKLAEVAKDLVERAPMGKAPNTISKCYKQFYLIYQQLKKKMAENPQK